MAAVPNILVVDDSSGEREGLITLLKHSGLEARGARDGIEALEKIHGEHFDLYLVDVWMPRMTGLELLEHLPKDPPPKVVVMTADDAPETLLAALRKKACSYITKPFDAKRLVQTVREVLAAPAEPPIEVVSAEPHWVELLVPCDRAAAERIQDFLDHLKADLPDEVREAVGLAFRELLMNAIEWGGELKPEQKVRVAYLRTERMLMYRIADPGKGFSLAGVVHAAIANPPESPYEHDRVRRQKGLRPGGFGILLARAMVDEVLYNEAHNEVVLIKYLA